MGAHIVAVFGCGFSGYSALHVMNFLGSFAVLGTNQTSGGQTIIKASSTCTVAIPVLRDYVYVLLKWFTHRLGKDLCRSVPLLPFLWAIFSGSGWLELALRIVPSCPQNALTVYQLPICHCPSRNFRICDGAPVQIVSSARRTGNWLTLNDGISQHWLMAIALKADEFSFEYSLQNRWLAWA